jgi:hypothetical protein
MRFCLWPVLCYCLRFLISGFEYDLDNFLSLSWMKFLWVRIGAACFLIEVAFDYVWYGRYLRKDLVTSELWRIWQLLSKNDCSAPFEVVGPDGWGLVVVIRTCFDDGCLKNFWQRKGIIWNCWSIRRIYSSCTKSSRCCGCCVWSSIAKPTEVQTRNLRFSYPSIQFREPW